MASISINSVRRKVIIDRTRIESPKFVIPRERGAGDFVGRISARKGLGF